MCFTNRGASAENQQLINPKQPASRRIFKRRSNRIVLEYKYCTDNKVFNTASPRIENNRNRKIYHWPFPKQKSVKQSISYYVIQRLSPYTVAYGPANGKKLVCQKTVALQQNTVRGKAKPELSSRKPARRKSTVQKNRAQKSNGRNKHCYKMSDHCRFLQRRYLALMLEYIFWLTGNSVPFVRITLS